MVDVTATPTPSIFGEGPPSAIAQNGVRYFDVSVNPYAEYVCFGGAWNGPLAGGASNPYVVGYPPNGVKFLFPYSSGAGGYAYMYASDGAISAADNFSSTGGKIGLFSGDGGALAGNYTYSFGGYITVTAGDGGAVSNNSRGYGGRISLYAGNANSGDGAYGGDIRLYAGDGNGITYSYGGDIRIGSGRGYAATYSYGGDVYIYVATGTVGNGNMKIVGLPILNPGGTGNVWNNGGTLSIT